MNRFFKIAIITCVSAFCCLAQESADYSAKDNNLVFGVGFAVRDFAKTRIKGGNSGNSLLYSGRNLGSVYESAYIDITSSSRKENVEAEDSLGLLVSLGYKFYKGEKITFSAIGNFQYFEISNAFKLRDSSVTTYTYIPILHPDFGTVNGDSYKSYETAKAKINLDMYVLDLGIQADYALTDSINIFAATGPSVTFTDMDSKVDDVHDSDNDVIFGMYASLGLGCQLTEHIGLSCEIRYDVAFDEAETKLAKQEIDGLGGNLKLLFSF